MAEKMKRREEAKAKLEEEKKTKNANKDGEESMVDEVYGALKGGEVFKARRKEQKEKQGKINHDLFIF